MFRQAIFTSMLAGAMALGLAGDAPERGRELMRLVPELDPQVAGHLVRDTEAEFREYCRGIGPIRTGQAAGVLNASVRTDSLDAFRESMQALYPFVRRVADALSSEFDRPEVARIYQFRASLAESSWAYGWEHRRCLNDFDSLNWNTRLKPLDKIRAYSALANRFAAFGDQREILNIEALLAGEVSRAGRFDLRVRLLRSSLARALWMREEVLACQLYGELGDAYGRMGHLDSALACYRKGIARADRHFVLEQSSRLRFFLARHYFAEGRLSMMGAMLSEAIQASRRFGGDPLDIRALLFATQYYARLQCWDMVDRNLERFPVMLRAMEDADYRREAQEAKIGVRRLLVMSLAAKGRAAEAADSLVRFIADARANYPKPRMVSLLLSNLAQAALQDGRPREAIAHAESAMALAEQEAHFRSRKEYALTLARAGIQGHLPEVAERGVAESIRVGPGESPEMGAIEIYVMDALRAQIALERSDERGAHRFVRSAMQGLRDTVAALDRGPYTDLTVMAASDLWHASHRLLAASPLEGLAFERHWRSLPSFAGRSPPAAIEPGPELSLAPRSIELVYAPFPEGIVRWTVTSTSVRRDTLALAVRECGPLVERVVELASRDPGASGAGMPPELITLARRLGRELLPEELRDRPTDVVSVSADGALARLPFELLDVSPRGAYEPLLSRCDVRRIRYVRPRERRSAPEKSVILADAARSAALRGHPTLPPLPAVGSEVALANATLPNPRVHDTGRMWKPELLEEWRQATNVYVAAHLVRHPEAPLFNYFPIAMSEDSRTPEDGYLDIRDVRDTDMSRCRLVVLSSCASGEPYVAGSHSGPSMADAFLDAGAEAVIHTRWRVRDEAAAMTAPDLARAWLESKGGRLPGWLAARRERIRGPRGIRHPFEWAAWSVTTAQPVPLWTGSTGAVQVAKSANARHAPAVPAARAVKSFARR